MASACLLLFALLLPVGLARARAGGVGAGQVMLGFSAHRARRLGWLLVGAGPATSQASAPGTRVIDPHHRIDSVAARLRAHPQPDTVRAVRLMDLTFELSLYDTRSAAPVLTEMLALVRHLHYRDYLAEGLLMHADYYAGLARYEEALRWLDQAQAEFARLGNAGGPMHCLGRRARIADQQGRYAQALDYAFRGMALHSDGPERRFHVSLRIQVASVYARIGEYQLARTHLLEALRVAHRWDYPDRINLALGELGEVSRYQRQWPAARRYYAQSRAVSQQLADLPHVLRMDLNWPR